MYYILISDDLHAAWLQSEHVSMIIKHGFGGVSSVSRGYKWTQRMLICTLTSVSSYTIYVSGHVACVCNVIHHDDNIVSSLTL